MAYFAPPTPDSNDGLSPLTSSLAPHSNKKPIILHLGEPIRYNHDVYIRLLSQFHVIRPAAIDLERLVFEKHLRERTWGDFSAIMQTSWRSGNTIAPWNEDLIKLLPKTLQVIASAGAGFDWVDERCVAEHGIIYCNNIYGPTKSVDDTALRYIISVFRNTTESSLAARSCSPTRWIRAHTHLPTNSYNPNSHTLGIVGLNSIGMAVAKKAYAGLNMKILYTDISRQSPAQEAEINAIYYTRLTDMLPHCACVLLVTSTGPLLLTASTIGLLPRGARIVNIAHGKLIDETALADALESGHISAAGLDVHEHEPNVNKHEPGVKEPGVNERLARMSNVTMTSHISDGSLETNAGFELLSMENCERVLSNCPPLTAVNLQWLRRRRASIVWNNDDDSPNLYPFDAELQYGDGAGDAAIDGNGGKDVAVGSAVVDHDITDLSPVEGQQTQHDERQSHDTNADIVKAINKEMTYAATTAVTQINVPTNAAEEGTHTITTASGFKDKGHDSIVELLFQHEANVKAAKKDGWTTLHAAALIGQQATVELLLKHGADATAVDEDGDQPILGAAQNGYDSIVELLIEHGASLRIGRKNGWTALHAAALNGHRSTVELLLKHGANVTAVDTCVGDGNVKSEIQSCWEPLLLAAAGKSDSCGEGQNQAAVLELLLLTDYLNINAAEMNGRTALSLAAGEGRYTSVKLLLASDNTDVNYKDGDGRTPLSWAAARGHEAVVALLLTKDSINPNLGDRYRQTPLLFAARNDHGPVVETLLAYSHIDLESRDIFSRSPRIWAAINGNSGIAKLLRENNEEHSDDAGSPLAASLALGHDRHICCSICLSLIIDSKLHYHCRICSHGDFNLCLDCHSCGAFCFDQTHQLTKRTLGGGDSMEVSYQLSNCIRHTIQAYVSAINGVYEMSCRMPWHILQFCEDQLDGDRNLCPVITLTGTPAQAQAAACGDFVEIIWGTQGLLLLDGMTHCLSHGSCDINHLSLRVRIRTYDASPGKSKNADAFISGALEDVVSAVEQLAWFAASFRRSISDDLTISSVTFKKLDYAESAKKTFQQSQATFELQLDILQSTDFESHIEEKTSPTCWQGLFQGGILASGFPVAPREEGLGLEIPYELMACFAQVRVSMTHDSGPILFGHSTCLFPAKKLQSGVQWHLVKSNDSDLLRDSLSRGQRICEGDISALTSLRTFLGYSDARVLLGTEKLFHTSNTTGSGLPTSSSKLELAREGTTSAGFSVKGIFNFMVAGKWAVPKGLRVNLIGNRGYSDRLDNASERPILLYDRRIRSAWLVSELSLVLHMVLTYLRRPKVQQRCCNQEESQTKRWPLLPFADACSDGGTAAHEAISKYRDLFLYSNEKKEEVFFWNEVDDFLKDLGSIRQAENLGKATSGWQFSSSRLRGWDFIDLVNKDEEICQREMPTNSNKASWWRLSEVKDILVIFGQDFGQLIVPDLTKSKVCYGWDNLPGQAELLAASMPCVRHLVNQSNVETSEHGPYFLMPGLAWHKPTERHNNCSQHCNESCLCIHELHHVNGARMIIPRRSQINPPRNPYSSAAVIFGNPKFYHESLSSSSFS